MRTSLPVLPDSLLTQHVWVNPSSHGLILAFYQDRTESGAARTSECPGVGVEPAQLHSNEADA